MPLLFNDDVISRIVQPDEPDPVYFSNSDGDDLYFIPEGGGVLRSPLGDLRFAPHDYVFRPQAGSLHRFIPDERRRTGCRSSARRLRAPQQWRNAVGQLRMDAPY